MKELYGEQGLHGIKRGIRDFVIHNTPILSRYLPPIAEFGLHQGTSLILNNAYSKYISRDTSGTNVYDLEWDILIILDTLRTEWVLEVIDDFEFLNYDQSYRSVGGRTIEWVNRTFSEASHCDEQTLYIHGSKFGTKASNFENVEEKRVETDDLKYPSAEKITDEARNHLRYTDSEKIIIHYCQPHYPVFTEDETGVDTIKETIHGSQYVYNKYKHLESSEHALDKVREYHIQNLNYVLKYVSTLIRSIEDDKSVLITADHSQMMGDRGIVGHPAGLSNNSVREVPLVKIENNQNCNDIHGRCTTVTR